MVMTTYDLFPHDAICKGAPSKYRALGLPTATCSSNGFCCQWEFYIDVPICLRCDSWGETLDWFQE